MTGTQINLTSHLLMFDLTISRIALFIGFSKSFSTRVDKMGDGVPAHSWCTYQLKPRHRLLRDLLHGTSRGHHTSA